MRVYLLLKTARHVSMGPYKIHGTHSTLELARKEGRGLDESWRAWIQEHFVDGTGYFTVLPIHPSEDKECTL